MIEPNAERKRLPYSCYPQNKKFKSFIFFSLALSMNFGNAEPTLTYSFGGTQTAIAPQGFSWDNKGTLNGFYQPLITEDKTLAKEFQLKFDVPKEPDKGGVTTTIKDDNITISVDGTILQGHNTMLTLITQNKGLAVNNGNGTLILDFAPSKESKDWNIKENGSLYSRRLVLDFSGTTTYETRDSSTRSTSFLGNLVIVSGRAQTQYGENYFLGTFNGDIIGSIKITNATYTYRDLQASLTFKDTASIFGNIATEAGKTSLSVIEKNLFVFEGREQNIQGNISATGSWNHFEFSNGGEKTITGNISALADAYKNSAKNTIDFNSSGNNAIIGNISTTPFNHIEAINTITFSAGINTIAGNITANWYGGGESCNTIQAKDESQSLTITGQITAHAGKKNQITLEVGKNTLQNKDGIVLKAEGGTNTVTFSGNKDAKILGNISSYATSSKAAGSNIIIFKTSSINAIEGNITATPFYDVIGKNDISFANGTNTIIGDITSRWNGAGDAGLNIITVKENSSSLVIDGTLIAYAGKNIVTLSVGNNQLKNSNAKPSLLASGGKNEVTVSNNTTLSITSPIIAKAGSNSITSKGSKNSFGDIQSTGGVNFLLLNGGGGSENKFQGDISAYAGENIILIQASSSTNTFGTNQQRIALTARSSGVKVGQNLISITQSTANTTLNFSSISLSNDNNGNYLNQLAQNLFSLDGTITLHIQNLSTTTKNQNANGHNQNIIAKDILTSPQDSPLQTTLKSDLSIDSYFNDSHAFSGQLAISSGVLAETGVNTLSFKATSSQSTPLISANSEGTAILGGVNLYLNLKDSNIKQGVENLNLATDSFDLNTAFITGDIIAKSSAPTNIKIIGSSSIIQIGIMGNITAQNRSKANLILEDSLLAPSVLLIPKEKMQTPIKNPFFIKNLEGKTTIITRFNNDAIKNFTAIYDLKNQSGEINLVFQKSSNIGINLSYSSGSISNFVFADKSDGNDSFLKDSTKMAKNQFLGKTYQDGVKITLQNTYQLGKELFTSILVQTQLDGTIDIKGIALGSIRPLADTSKNFRVFISKDSVFAGSILLEEKLTSLTMGQGAKFLVKNKTFSTTKLVLGDGKANLQATEQSINFDSSQLRFNLFSQTNTIIDLATIKNVEKNTTSFKVFRIGVNGDKSKPSDATGLQGQNALFRVYVDDNATQTPNTSNQYIYSDRIIVADIGSQTDTQQIAQTHYIQIIPSPNTSLKKIFFDSSKDSEGKGGTAIKGNIAVATIKNGQSITNNPTRALVQFVPKDSIQGFDQVSTILIAQLSDENGITGDNHIGWTTYFINSISTQGISKEREKVSASALYTNYDLFFININSLNKRMGELRDNPFSQGVWGRIFGGVQNNDMGLGTKTSYFTIQGGYDYAFKFENGNNYLGAALSYSQSNSKIKHTMIQTLNQELLELQDIKSKAIEVAVYNSYVENKGWYNDNIFKLSYIMSDFSLQHTPYELKNIAFTLSDEFGYRFKLGEYQEWLLDPQMSITLGYFEKLGFKQTLGDSWLNCSGESLFMLRTRLGGSFGYDFKYLSINKPISANVYLGVFYEYDYVAGGSVFLKSNLGGETRSASAISSNGRVLVNLGSNINVKEHTRIYIDLQKSFAGKITTEYQINVGVRYGFGEGGFTF